MKKIVLKFFTYISILYLSDIFIKGFDVKFSITLVVLALILSISELTIKPVVGFLTLPINFLTYGFFNMIICGGIMFLYSFIIPGFDVTAGTIGPFNSSFVESSEIKLTTQFATLFLASFTISLLNTIINWTTQVEKSKSK